MPQLKWIEMPVIGNATPDDPVRPKHPVATNAFLVYRGSKVYVAFESQSAKAEALQQPDVRPLTDYEGLEFEASLPYPIPSSPFWHGDEGANKNQPLRLGDVISWLTHKIGIQECAGCQKRRHWLNKLVIWGWWRRRTA